MRSFTPDVRAKIDTDTRGVALQLPAAEQRPSPTCKNHPWGKDVTGSQRAASHSLPSIAVSQSGYKASAERASRRHPEGVLGSVRVSDVASPQGFEADGCVSWHINYLKPQAAPVWFSLPALRQFWSQRKLSVNEWLIFFFSHVFQFTTPTAPLRTHVRFPQ